ncbi:MAG: pyruvate kinase [Thermoproteota archaeon]|nr:MAG: pyruvate kinase [Candidatus Korarchaeota archaeon]
MWNLNNSQRLLTRMKRAKIIATLGPACENLETMVMMLKEGVDALRINFAHGEVSYWNELIEKVRRASSLVHRKVALIGDLSGPTVRLGRFDDVVVEKGEEILFFLSKESNVSKKIPIAEEKVFSVISEGDILLIDEGRIKLVVKETGTKEFKSLALNSGVIKAEKNIAIKNKTIPLPPLSEKDVNNVKFVVQHEMDYVGMSFVRTGQDISILRRLLDEIGGKNVGIIAKIETKDAVDNISEITEQADAILVARGDLGLHYDLETIPRIQRSIISEALRKGKPSIVATQLLESMIEHPSPTRSEVVDIMSAVQDGADALMLASETAIGKYPVEAVRWMKRIIEAAEREFKPPKIKPEAKTIYDRFARGIALLADSLEAKIVIFTRTGATARRMSAQRPISMIYAASNDEKVSTKLAIYWGVFPYTLEEGGGDPIQDFINKLKLEGKLSYGDVVVFTYGLRRGATDIVRIVEV